MWTSKACKYFYLLPLKLEKMFCICDLFFGPTYIAAEIGSKAVTALAKFTICTSVEVQCLAFSSFSRKNGLPFIHQEGIRKGSLLDKGKDFFFVSHGRAAELFLPHLSAPLLSKLMPRVLSLQGRKKLLSTSSS